MTATPLLDTDAEFRDLEQHWQTVVDDQRYRIRDLEMGPFTLSETVLHAGQSTKGHSHPWPEVYVGTAGEGVLYLDGDGGHPLTPGARHIINSGVHHRVATDGGVTFTCVFEGPRR